MNNHVGGFGAGLSIPMAAVAFFAHTLPILQWFAAAIAIIAGSITIGSWVFKGIALWTAKQVKKEMQPEVDTRKHPTLK